MTGGREVVKCMVPGTMDSSWADDTEDVLVEGNEERSVLEHHE